MHLYTMRTPLAADFAGTLERLARIGYATVGVSGRLGNSPSAIRQMLDMVRLRAVLEHVGYDTVTGSGLPQALKDVHTLGGQWIVVPSLPGALHSPAGYREVARQFNRAGLAARESGLKLLYHNHGGDHEVVDGVSLYDILLAETDPDLVGFELDVYWAAKGGSSAPGELFVRHPGRFPAIHVKDMARTGTSRMSGRGCCTSRRCSTPCGRAGCGSGWWSMTPRPTRTPRRGPDTAICRGCATDPAAVTTHGTVGRGCGVMCRGGT